MKTSISKMETVEKIEMNMGIEINILYHNDKTKSDKEMGVDFDWRELDVRQCYLNNFDAAHPVYNNEIEYTEIYFGGQTLICLMEYKDFLEAIKGKI